MDKLSLLLWLCNAHKMAKRVYVNDEDNIEPNKLGYSEMGYSQLIDGAIPMWWINQEIERVVKEIVGVGK